MATPAAAIGRKLDTEKIIEFSPEALRAPFALRCAALIIDYMVLLAMPVVWLVLARFLSDTGVPDTIGKTVWTMGVLLFVVDCLVMPMGSRYSTICRRVCTRRHQSRHALPYASAGTRYRGMRW